MAARTSEQILSGLEYSSKPAIDLLDEAAETINLRYSPPTNVYISTASSVGYKDANKSREQWLLRWVVKRLNTEVEESDKSRQQELLHDARTWSLLQHLIRTIPTHALRNIFNERHFWQVLGPCLEATQKEILHGSEQDEFRNAASAVDSESGRPTKKRRSSSDTARSSLLHEQICSVLTSLANALSSSRESDGMQLVRPVIITIKADTAAILLGQVLSVLNLSRNSKERHELSQCLQCYTQIWEHSTWTVDKSTKQSKHDLFRLHVLSYALDVLNPHIDHAEKALHSSLERLIAVHYVLPTRRIFPKHGKSSRNAKATEQDEPNDRDAVVDAITRALEPIAARLCSHSCARLLRIACRIAPPNNLMERKAETLGIEALFYTLVYLFNQIDFVKQCDHHDSEEEDSISSSAQHVKLLLDVLEKANVEPSSSYYKQFVENYLQQVDVDVAVLAQISKLNASLFVPKPDSHGISLLNAVAGCIRGSVGWDQMKTETFVSGILEPLIEAAGRARQLGPWIEFWEGMLRETYQFRQSNEQSKSSEKASANVWDDPGLFKIFTSVCEQHASLTLYRPLLDQLKISLEELPQLVGPTQKIFAKVAIACAVLKPLSNTSAGSAMLSEMCAPLARSVGAALKRSNTYQGQQWQLFKLLCVILEVRPDALGQDEVIEEEALREAHSLARDDELQHSPDPKPEHFLGIMWSFFYLVDHYVHQPELYKEAFCRLLDAFRRGFENSIDKSDEIPLHIWNGADYDMNSHAKMFSASLSKLASVSDTWIHTNNGKQLVTSIFRFLVSTKYTPGDSSLLAQLDVFLVTMLRDTNMDIADLWKENLHETTKLKHIPNSMLQRCAQPLKKSAAQILLNSLLSTLSAEPEEIEDTTFVNCLEIVHTIITGHSSLADDDMWEEYCKALDRKTKYTDPDQTITASNSIFNLVNCYVDQISIHAHDKQEIKLDVLFKRVKKQLKKVTTSKKNKLAGRFTILLVLAVVSVLDEETRPHLCELKDAIDIKQLFRDHALALVSALVAEKADATSCLIVWRIWAVLYAVETGPVASSQTHAASDIARRLNMAISSLTNRGQQRPGGKHLSQNDVSYLAFLSSSSERIRASSTSVGMLRGLLETPNDAESAVVKIERNIVQARKGPVVHVMPESLRQLLLSCDEEKIFSSDTGRAIEQYLSLAVFVRASDLELLAKSPRLSAGLGQLASLQAAQAEPSATALLLRLETSRIISRKHKEVVNQHVIDSTLSSIALLTSSSSKTALTTDKHDPEPRHVFDRLCGVLSILLLRYRRRLTGRYHLLINALQNLLKCLFYPPSRNLLNMTSSTYPSKAAFLASLPQWLDANGRTSGRTLPPASAAKFSRILQTLCDPSASTARMILKRRHDGEAQENFNLTDETRILRRQVSQHTQYLLQTYCQVMLDGYIAREVKDNLMPGMYAILSATDIEILWGVNSGMNESQRAIWKDLYADWKKYGVWNQK